MSVRRGARHRDRAGLLVLAGSEVKKDVDTEAQGDGRLLRSPDNQQITSRSDDSLPGTLVF